MLQFVKRYIGLFSFLAVLILLVSCANIAAPTGGSFDFDPPKVVKINPGFNATNVSQNKVEIYFDENVTIKDASDKVIVTPPQQKSPIIRSVNKKVTVELRDTLMPNTTYTIDFTDAIQDNNEGNPIENFAISFSTGDVVDSMAISGKVLTADNLEPVKGIYVGLHSNLNDTAFTHTKFLRISRTNETGDFTIRGVAPGEYRLYALDDASRAYMYNNPAQAIAFYDSIIRPSSEMAFHMDTIYNDKDKKDVDTIVEHQYTKFLPDNVILRSFTSNFKRKYLQKYDRLPQKLGVFFGAPTAVPKLKPLNFAAGDDWAVLERNAQNDSLYYWVKDPGIMALDTIKFEMTFLETDSLNQDIWVSDTLRFVDRNKKSNQKKKDKKKDEEEEEPIKLLEIKTNLSGNWDVFKDISLEFVEPIIDSLSGKIRIQQKVDSVFNDIAFTLSVDSLNPRKYTLKHKWGYNTEYKMILDSASVHSIYGLWNGSIDQAFRTKKEDEYAKLAIIASGSNGKGPAFIELLDKSDKPVRKATVKDEVAVFRDLLPGEYYARIIFDTNGNGVWDTGNYYTHTQPELVYYCNNIIKLRAFAEDEVTWPVDMLPLDKQKPLEITKNKPKDKDERRKKLEEQEEKERGSRNTDQQNNGYGTDGRTGNNSQFNNMSGQQMNLSR